MANTPFLRITFAFLILKNFMNKHPRKQNHQTKAALTKALHYGAKVKPFHHEA
jgi:hypothetical protein